MNGIKGTIGGRLLKAPDIQQNVVQQFLSIESLGITLQWNSQKKFVEDKLLYDDAKYTILLDGVIFNRKDLQKGKSWIETIVYMYQRYGQTWFQYLRGSFYGMLVDKQKKTLFLFVDQIGDKPIFFYTCGESFYFASEQLALSSLLKENNCISSIHEGAVYCMLTYGYLLDDISYISGAKRLKAGCYLEYDMTMHKVEYHCYHQFMYHALREQDEDAILANIHSLFNKAITLQVNKNKEYNYKDYSALSGGMDSRLTTCAIARLKQREPFTTFTYAPIGQTDQQIAFKVAQRINNVENLFFSTSSGELLTYIDRSVRVGDGLYAYYGTATLLSMFDVLDKENIGIIHSGQLGDAVIGSIIHNERHNQQPYKDLNCITKRFQSKLLENGVDIELIGSLCGSRELYSLYNRGLSGVIFGANKAFQSFSETFSPFYDVDFWDYCLSIPRDLRQNHKLYDKYFLKYYYEYADISHNGNRIIGKKLYNTMRELNDTILKKVRKSLGMMPMYQSVTPLQQWELVPKVRIVLDSYFNKTINDIEISDGLRKDIASQYLNGSALERNMALTALSMIKQLE